jgi:hypothetical protein
MKFLKYHIGASALIFLVIASTSPWWWNKLKSDSIPLCTVPEGVSSVSVRNTPAALLQSLEKDVGDIAAPGEEFDATDVVVTGRDRRILFIWNAGRRWIVATEHGGRGYNNPVFAFDLSQDNRQATKVQAITAVPDTVCSISAGLIRFSSSAPE